MPPVSPRCTEEPLVEPFRTAVRAEMAKSGHALHPAICRSDAPELVVVVVACGGHGEAFCENEHSWRAQKQHQIETKCNHPHHRDEREREVYPPRSGVSPRGARGATAYESYTCYTVRPLGRAGGHHTRRGVL